MEQNIRENPVVDDAGVGDPSKETIQDVEASEEEAEKPKGDGPEDSLELSSATLQDLDVPEGEVDEVKGGYYTKFYGYDAAGRTICEDR